MTARDAVIGIDLGTTMSKALVRTPTGEQLALAETRTPWTTTPDGGTENSAERFAELAVDLLRHGCERAGAPLRVSAVAVAGLAESGVLLDGSGNPRTPVVAWFDRRGARQVESIMLRANDFGSRFVRRTGLPWDCQASVAKLLWFVDDGLELTPAHRWLSVPEYVVHRLGGELVREPSLASRTGLLDQATGAPWADGAVELGLPPTLLPASQPYGESVGTLRHAGLPDAMQGAALLVAGHDHPVAAIGVGATGADELVNSTGTADVVVRSLPGLLTDEQRESLVGQGISVGMHVLPDTSALIGGVRGGLLLRRVLGLLGVTTAVQREALDRAALAVGSLPAGLDVSGAGPTGDDVVLRVRDDADPATVWAAATRYTARETRALLDLTESVVGPHARAVASGGWTRMASVRTAKSAVIEHLTFSELPEPVAAGAAALAQRATTASPV
jgi:sugar (pentulose or hexulose) kinase